MLEVAVAINVLFFSCPANTQGVKYVSGSISAEIETGAGLSACLSSPLAWNLLSALNSLAAWLVLLARRRRRREPTYADQDAHSAGNCSVGLVRQQEHKKFSQLIHRV